NLDLTNLVHLDSIWKGLVWRPLELPGVKRWQMYCAGVNGSGIPSPDGSLVAFPCSDGTIRILDSLTGKLQHLLLGSNRFTELAWSPTAIHLAAVNNPSNRIWIWNILEARPERILGEQTNPNIFKLAWSPDEDRLAVSQSGEGGELIIWDVV